MVGRVIYFMCLFTPAKNANYSRQMTDYDGERKVTKRLGLDRAEGLSSLL